MAEAELLTVQEVAQRLKLHEEAIRSWIASGKVKAVRLGAARAGWRIPESEIQRVLAGGDSDQTEAP